MAEGEVDPRGETLAAASAGAEAAARTLTEAAATRPRAAPSDDLIGKHLAHFRVERRLGRGGMGEVFLATDLALDRPVAVKVLAREIAEDAAFRERFIREARAQARINHPNICHIYFIGEQDGRMFFAMEYVDGENLGQRVERAGKLPYGEALDLVRQAAAGLAEAHRRGFTHRDVKPSNLLVDRHGVVKVADFGLVKDAARGDVADTGATAIVGTPLFMAPEQARGEPVDHRADIYALGVTLHTLVAGKPPFDGPTPLALVSKHLSEPRPKLEPAKGTPLVDRLLDRMMAKKPAARFGSYDELLEALDQASPRVTRAGGIYPRAAAVVIDALVALLFTLPLQGLAELAGGARFEFYAWVAAIYVIVCNAIFGRTYGKRALELRIVVDAVEERRRRGVGWRRAVVRWLVEYGPVFGGVYAVQAVERLGQGWGDVPRGVVQGLFGTVAVLPYLVAAIFAERAAGKRAWWDRVAGTRVVYVRDER
jgi:hypothetical protein